MAGFRSTHDSFRGKSGFVAGATIVHSVVLALLISHSVAAEPRSTAISEGKMEPPYALNETALRRLDALLTMQLDHQVKDGKNHFKIVHSNHTTYETDNIEDVLRDINSESNPITSISVTALGPFPTIESVEGLPPDERASALDQLVHDLIWDSRPRIDVKFGSDGVQFTVEGRDTGWVLASRSELETSLKSVRRSNYTLPASRAAVGVSVAFILFLFFVRRARDGYDETKGTRTSLHSYVWDVRDPFWTNQPARFWMLVIGSAAVGIILGRSYTYLIRYLFPPAVFELGDEVKVYADLLTLRNDLFLGVIVGLVVTVIGGLITMRLFGEKTPAPVLQPLGSNASAAQPTPGSPNEPPNEEWTPARMLHLAESIGPQTARLFERILADKSDPKIGCRLCLETIRRIEASAKRAVAGVDLSYKSVESILKNSLVVAPPVEPPRSLPPPPQA